MTMMRRFALFAVLAASIVTAFQAPQMSSHVSAIPALQARVTSTALAMASTTSNEDPTVLDTEAIGKYVGALGIEMAGLATSMAILDQIAAYTGEPAPFALNFALFYGLSLKSRIFSPLEAARPKPKGRDVELPADKDLKSLRKMPSWTPPGFVFPIMWILIIGPLRAGSSALLLADGGASYCSVAILSLLLHLSIGDVWNTINNVECRYGTSVLGVACVWASAANAAYQYYQVYPEAGQFLALPLIWLTIASTLVTRTWQINPIDEASGRLDTLYPTVVPGEPSKTKFVWFEK